MVGLVARRLQSLEQRCRRVSASVWVISLLSLAITMQCEMRRHVCSCGLGDGGGVGSLIPGATHLQTARLRARLLASGHDGFPHPQCIRTCLVPASRVCIQHDGPASRPWLRGIRGYVCLCMCVWGRESTAQTRWSRHCYHSQAAAAVSEGCHCSGFAERAHGKEGVLMLPHAALMSSLPVLACCGNENMRRERTRVRPKSIYTSIRQKKRHGQRELMHHRIGRV